VISHCDIDRYRLALRHPWRSARTDVGARQGWLVRLADDVHVGFGDCAPLPEAGTESHDEAALALGRWQTRLIGQTIDAALADLDHDESRAPAARFAIESALLDILTRRLGLALRDWLADGATGRIAVNTMLGPVGSTTPEAVDAARAHGFRVLKLKVGLDDPATELARLAAVVREVPQGVALRLDANGAWDLATAERFIQAAKAWPIEAIEEPLREPLDADLRSLQALAPFSIALDESLHRHWSGLLDPVTGAARDDLAQLPVRRLVLKPAACGGLRSTLAFAEQAIAAGIEVVITSLIESAAGIWPTVQLAAAIPSPLPHGVATSSWLQEDLGDAPTISDGHISLPRHAGSGFCPTHRMPSCGG
jgi:o-succinylbenzoate synthase